MNAGYNLDGLATMLQVNCPFPLPFPLAQKLGEAVVDWCRNNTVAGASDWPAALELVGLVWGSLPTELAIADLTRLPDEIDAKERVRRADALMAKIAPNRTRPPVPPNLFAVGMQGDYIVWLRKASQKLHKTEARNLAVWLAVLSDPFLDTFLSELEAASP